VTFTFLGRWARFAVPRDRFDFGWEKFDVYLGGISIRSPLLELKELNHLGN